MPIYHYKALDKSGREIKSIIEGTSARGVRDSLRNSGFFVVDLKEISKTRINIDIGCSLGKINILGKKNKLHRLVIFTRLLTETEKLNIAAFVLLRYSYLCP